MTEERENLFIAELTHLLNKYSIDNKCNVPDFILATHLCGYLGVFKIEKDAEIQYSKLRQEILFESMNDVMNSSK